MFTNTNSSRAHKYFMKLAFQQAKINLGNTKQNPSVGCIIVKNNNVVSAACTGVNGIPHAEKNAISLTKEKLTNSFLYTTLEPCTHYGKTPPCVNLIKNKKIKKIFFSSKDPDLRTFDKCKKILKDSRIIVHSGISINHSKKFYNSYFKTKSNKLPFVSAKIAVTKDLFSVNKKNKWITNFFSRGRVHLMRSEHDCIITTYKTVIKDNPMLNCRIKGLESRSPARVIIDRNLKTPISSKVVKSAKKITTIIFYNKAEHKKIKIFKKFNVKMIKSTIYTNGHLNLKKILFDLKKIGYSRIFLESGVTLFNSFLAQKLVDELHVFISSKKINKLGYLKVSKYVKSILRKKPLINNVNLLGDTLKSYRIK